VEIEGRQTGEKERERKREWNMEVHGSKHCRDVEERTLKICLSFTMQTMACIVEPC